MPFRYSITPRFAAVWKSKAAGVGPDLFSHAKYVRAAKGINKSFLAGQKKWYIFLMRALCRLMGTKL